MSSTAQLRLVKAPSRPRPQPLWREAVGARLRHLRRRRQLTLVEVADRAGISPQYLSELERGRKDPSSEVLAAVTVALDSTVQDVMQLAALDLRRGHASLAPAPAGEIQLAA
jgi:transcriptional regulator with XRE-family HTH domain